MSASDDLRRSDAVAAALNRGLNVDPIPWGQLLAIGQQELGRYQQRRTLDSAQDLYEEETAGSLIAAARIILEVACRAPTDQNHDKLAGDDFTCAEISEKIERQRLLLLSSCAFAMYGNFASAAAVQRSLNIKNLQTEGQLLALAVSNPRQIPAVLQSPYIMSNGRNFLERLNFFLITGDESSKNNLITDFEGLMHDLRAPLEIALLRCVRLALKHITILATANLFRLEIGDVLNDFLERLISDGRHCLLPPQYTLIHDYRFLKSGANTIVTIPTSTGKTLLGELAIAASLRDQGDIAVYVTPYIALGRQVYESFKRHAPMGTDVRGYFGGFNSNTKPISRFNPTIIIATPERLDAILRSQDLYSSLRTVIFDEAHGIENGVRGARLEALITRIRLQQFTFKTIRIVLGCVIKQPHHFLVSEV